MYIKSTSLNLMHTYLHLHTLKWNHFMTMKRGKKGAEDEKMVRDLI